MACQELKVHHEQSDYIFNWVIWMDFEKNELKVNLAEKLKYQSILW
jgi:hypothetical protein